MKESLSLNAVCSVTSLILTVIFTAGYNQFARLSYFRSVHSVDGNGLVSWDQVSEKYGALFSHMRISSPDSPSAGVG